MINQKKEIGRRIRRIRNGLGQNQTEFGEHLGVVASSVSAYEKGETSPSFEMISKIAKLGDMTIDDLLTRGYSDDPDGPYPVMYSNAEIVYENDLSSVSPGGDPVLNVAEMEYVLGKLFASVKYIRDKLGNGQLAALLEGVPTSAIEEDRRLLSAFHKLDENRRRRLTEEAEDMVLAMGSGGK